MPPPHLDAIARRAPTFARRRAALRAAVEGGLVLLPAAPRTWRNADNPHPYRQSSHLLWAAPVHRPGLALVLDADAGRDVLYGAPEDPDDVVWHGPRPSLAEEAEAVGITEVRPLADLPEALRAARATGRRVHLLPPFQDGTRLDLAAWLGVAPGELDALVSDRLVRALGDLRLVKDDEEIAEIERAATATAAMLRAGLAAAADGVPEAHVRAELARAAEREGMAFSFQPIVTVRGEVLHQEHATGTLRAGDLLLIDAGLETELGYAADLTRTAPVSGRFAPVQRDLYAVVLAALDAVVDAMRPGANWRALHDLAARVLARGLVDLGLLHGDPEEAVAAGAHALFFPHGIGHPLGLDVHDLHDLGDAVAYPPEAPRSTAFGTRALRFGRDLRASMVMTVEPGLYLIPALLARWRAEGRHRAFVNYDRAEALLPFGGIRIEDDVLVTETGARRLGAPLPRAPEEVEAAVGAG